MNAEEIVRLNKLWHAEVYDRAHEVDPGQEEDWSSLCLGWCIAKGLTIEQANLFMIQASL